MADGEARREPMLAEGYGGRLQLGNAAGADQHVDLEATLRHGEDAQVLGRPAYEFAHGGHGAA